MTRDKCLRWGGGPWRHLQTLRSPKSSGERQAFPGVEESELGSRDSASSVRGASGVASDATWWPRPLPWHHRVLSQADMTS